MKFLPCPYLLQYPTLSSNQVRCSSVQKSIAIKVYEDGPDVYRDDESPVIYDVDEERERRLERELEAEERGDDHDQPANNAVQQMPTKYAKYSLSRKLLEPSVSEYDF